MPDAKEKTAVPRLRFPEFRDAGPWEVKRLGEVCSTFSGGTPNSSRKDFYGGTIPFIRSAEIDQDSTELFITENGLINSSAKLIKKGDLLIALYGANSGDASMAKLDGAINQAILCLRSTFDLRFILNFWLLRKESIVQKYIQGGQGNLSGDIVKSIEFTFPTIIEQQKIADCLASLDDLIRAEESQLAALKDHKKGLMQQLFPREGETTPRLRFPEFRDAGPWEVKRLGAIGQIITGKTPRTSDHESWNGEIPWVTPTDISNTKRIYGSERKLTHKGARVAGLLPKDTVLVTCIASIGKNAILDRPGCCNQQINAIIPSKNFHADFVFYLIEKNHMSMINLAGGASPVIIPKSEFEKLKLPFPSFNEQQKIADCLSSLDDLIRAEESRLEALQAHKKGLMQQLFPQEVG